MKILGILTSNVTGGDVEIPQQDMFPARMQAALAKELNEHVDVEARSAWPTQKLPNRVDDWVRNFEPDLVVFSIIGFWFMYESTPVRLQRKLGLPGRILGRASREAAARPRLAHNRVFQWSRKRIQEAVGGQAWFTPEEVIASSQRVISTCLRRESTYIVVVGPSGGEKWARNEAHLRELLLRRRRVDREMAAFCKAHHVEYWDEPMLATITDPRPASLQGDDLHLDREGHRRLAEHQFGLALGMVRRAREHSRGTGGATAGHITADAL
ncbi:MAG: hypothetical protein ABI577_00560 [bacterium]